MPRPGYTPSKKKPTRSPGSVPFPKGKSKKK